MIKGIGCDIIELERIKKALARENFCKRIFTPKELEYAAKKGESGRVSSLAAAFAAKEAASKALGVGIGKVSWQDIEVAHDDKGKPYLILINEALKIAQELKVTAVYVSLSHSKEYAIATVVLEG